ncbi:CLUMA_CG009734, isoform A [Clunio marinus]|uniref:CLUMA_CG009734, isoform A n=1 Tax=Clunio marinus TaxID=568069 RepID=A0A1J1I7Z6_9DIPT|nr:CLUMA_CG009734, isoform A [Clunio marinus]
MKHNMISLLLPLIINFDGLKYSLSIKTHQKLDFKRLERLLNFVTMKASKVKNYHFTALYDPIVELID